MAIKPDKWTSITAPNPGAAMRLFCFPYAGAGASAFRDWPRYLPRSIELVAIQPPGRENRFSEPRLNRIEDYVQAVRSAVLALADKPFFFFGHSLGALAAFELTRLLQAAGGAAPFHLVVSGMQAPPQPRRREPLHGLADAEFLQRIGQYNGTPRELLQDAELMQLYLPLLRDDFTICETYVWRASAPLACPLTALGGSDDAEVALEDLRAWAGLAGSGYDEHVFDGDHFFIQPHKLRILELLGAIGRRAPRAGLPQAEAG